MQIFCRVGTCVSIFVMAASICVAQDVAVGTPALASVGGGPDNINIGNLNANWVIPILNNPGRGINMNYNLAYDSSIWYPVTSGGSMAWQPVANYGWQGLSAAYVGNVSYYSQYISQNCGPSGNFQIWAMGNFVYTDQNGTSHNIPGSGNYTISTGGIGCPSGNGPAPVGTTQSKATDGSGLTAYYTIGQGYITMYLVTSSNATLYPSLNGIPSSTPPITDLNGNQITLSNGALTDTLGNASLKIVGQAPETDVSYLTPAGTYATYKVTYRQYNIHTYFQCGGIGEFTASNVYLVDKVTLPDSTYYHFGYETTSDPSFPGYYSGRVASVSLPTGGTVTYGYTGGNLNHGIECMDGSTSGLTRTVSPGGNWTYSRSLVSGTAPAGSTWTTTTTDPAVNQTVINFAEDAAATSTLDLYPTQQKFYQGTTSGTLLLTKVTCYNAHYTGCATATVSSPVGQVDTYSVLPNSSTSLSEQFYSSLGQVTQDNEFDFGVTQGVAPGRTHLINQTSVEYATFGKPLSVIVDDWTSGGSVQLSSTTYSYDQTAVTGTTGTPQHISVTGPRGNLTTLAQVANSGTTLYQTFSYYDTGNLNTSTGLSASSTSPGPTTTYLYGTGSCGNSFATQTNEPLSLSRSFIWNCVGGVQTQLTDENSKIVATNYTDSEFWRPASSSDQEANQTLFAYNGQTAASSKMTFNSNNSASGSLITVDGVGRTILNQKLQGPNASTYDTTETDYNSVGLANRNTMPFSAVAGGTSSSAPGVTVTSYDSLGRPLQLSDSGGGTVTYTYTNNDVLQTTSGSQSFKKQFEYDGLGRLTSVCEMSPTLPGFGTCGQSQTQTGYWTKYTYDALGHLLTVTQNAQAVSTSQQHRSYTFDQLARLTSESNPETSNTSSNGTTTYTYDIACTTAPASPGDMTGRLDNAGNRTCFAYDALHRLTDAGYSTVCRRYRYDTSVTPPSGVTVTNTKARLLEAKTDNCNTTQYTDEWFSYSPRGELTDVYEKTPNSGSTFYHTSAAYWPNGTLQTLSGIASMPTLYYGASGGAGLDSEGRLTQVTTSSGQNPVTGTTYSTSSTSNYLGALTAVTYGSADSDSFTYDTNTGRPLTFQFSVNGQTDTDTLAWNANSTLASLGISDSISGTSDSQNCTYTYDDLGRIGGHDANGYSVDCGTKWQQLFTYDAFGNIVKSGSSSFAASYPNPNNHFTLSGGPTVQYDANGNLTTDNLNTYTWDPNWGNMTGVNGNSATYDAFGRVVEQKTGSSYTQIVYSPVGKFALMNGSSLLQSFVPLPGGGTAIYNSSGLAYYRHADWLGSSRLTSTAGRAKYSSSSYAPFGEQYAVTGSADPSFTGQNSDTVPSLYDFFFRRNSPSQGRWISPDPLGVGAVDVTNPQSWNRYAYVVNNPLAFVDPFGLWLQMFCSTVDSGIDTEDGSGVQSITTCTFWDDGQGNSTGYLPGVPLDTLRNLPTRPRAPNNGNQSSWQQKMRQASHFICGKSPGDRVAKSVLTGAAIGTVTGGIGGFVAGEVFGGEVTLGATGFVGAYLGAHVGAAVGAVNGLGQGAVLAGICYAGFQYDN